MEFVRNIRKWCIILRTHENMFYLKYLKSELTRRLGKTISISLGLAVASLIIILIISVSQGLSSAQEKVLNPLQNVGTDIMLTRSVDEENMRDVDEATRVEMASENRIETDLSTLGDPGESFINDVFLPGSLLTFAQTDTDKLKTETVSDYASGLILNVTHQEGAIPEVTAEIETGGEEVEINREIEPMTDEERKASDTARAEVEKKLQEQGIDPKSEEGREKMREVMDSSMPERFKNQTFKFQNPTRTYSQNVGPISTDIKTASFTVGGVDISKKSMGLILPDQITEGSYFTEGDQIIANQSYAAKNNIAVGGKVALGKKEYTVCGIVEPKLYSNTADLYLPLGELQGVSGKDGRVNLVLIKSASADEVAKTSEEVLKLFPGANIVDSQDTAEQVSGSLVSAANLTSRFIAIASIIVVLAAFIIVSLLTVSSVNKRTREIGTLKAIGWTNFEVVRQIVMENLALGIIGAVAGVALAVAAIVIFNQLGLSLTAVIAKGGLQGMMGGGPMREATNNSVSTAVDLQVAVNYIVILLGSAVAILGATISALVAGFKVSSLKPQVALRNVE